MASLATKKQKQRLQLSSIGSGPIGAAGGSAPAQGFSLDDQAAFAEEQLAMAYSGRGGLGSGSKGKGSNSGGGGGGAAIAPPQQLQPTESQARVRHDVA